MHSPFKEIGSGQYNSARVALDQQITKMTSPDTRATSTLEALEEPPSSPTPDHKLLQAQGPPIPFPQRVQKANRTNDPTKDKITSEQQSLPLLARQVDAVQASS